MTKLYVDIGNSRLKWMCFDNGEFTYGNHDNDLFFNHNPNAFEKDLILYQIESIHFCAVVSQEKIAYFKKWCVLTLGITAIQIQVSSTYKTLTNGYLKIESLGVDRWVAMIGAVNRFKPPFIVCDCGTAITIDAVNEQMEHIGGYILPGYHMMYESLGNKTAMDVGAIQNQNQTCPLGKSTETGISNGILFSITSTVAEAIKKQNNQSLLILTGGDAHQLSSYFDIPLKVEPHLVLLGLWDLSQTSL
jgi:type III pantothenate kinase